MTDINEGSTAYLDVSFKDPAGIAAVPASISYRIDCLTNGTVVKADTAITPASTVVITLAPSDNAIIDQTNHKEEKLLTLTATYGGGQAQNSQFEYFVVNLKRIN